MKVIGGLMDKKDWLPEGVTEEEFIAIVKRAAMPSCYKFKWGSNDINDMLQQSYAIAIKLLDPANNKFKPRGERPISLQLYNFLKVWLHNRLSNWRRDKCCRYPNKGGANQTKFYLNYPLMYNSLGLAQSEMFAAEGDIPERLAKEEIIATLVQGMDEDELVIYEKFIEGREALSESEELLLYRAVRRILPGTKENYV